MTYPANDPMDPREREVDSEWHRCADCNAKGAEFRLKRDRYLCDECAARLHAQEIAVIQDMLDAAPKPEPAESSAEPAQDDEAAIRDAEKRDEDRAKGDEPDPLEDNSILTSADIAELAKGAEMFVGDRVGGPKNRDIAEYEMVCSRSEYVAMARNLERFARENADLRAKLAAYEEHQGYRPLIPGNLIDRIDEHGQEWTRTERVRSTVAELVQPQTVEDITRLREKLAAAEERIAEMRGIAKGFFQWTVHGESTLTCDMAQASGVRSLNDTISPEIAKTFPDAVREAFDGLRAKLAAAHEQLRCPECGCATPEEAGASECGCDSPVCSVEVTTTVAKTLCETEKKLAAAESRIHDLGEMLGREIGRVAAAEARIAELGKGGA